jgi:hypothetical protein
MSPYGNKDTNTHTHVRERARAREREPEKEREKGRGGGECECVCVCIRYMLAKLLFAVERKTYAVSGEQVEQQMLAEEPDSVGSNARTAERERDREGREEEEEEEGLCKAKAGGKEGDVKGHRDSVLSNARTADSKIKGGRERRSEGEGERGREGEGSNVRTADPKVKAELEAIWCNLLRQFGMNVDGAAWAAAWGMLKAIFREGPPLSDSEGEALRTWFRIGALGNAPNRGD